MTHESNIEHVHIFIFILLIIIVALIAILHASIKYICKAHQEAIRMESDHCKNYEKMYATVQTFMKFLNSGMQDNTIILLMLGQVKEMLKRVLREHDPELQLEDLNEIERLQK